jgi:hypothetical protein
VLRVAALREPMVSAFSYWEAPAAAEPKRKWRRVAACIGILFSS